MGQLRHLLRMEMEALRARNKNASFESSASNQKTIKKNEVGTREAFVLEDLIKHFSNGAT